MTQPQTIFRAAHGKLNPYFQMLRTTAQDSSLSFEARGLIAYLLSKPNDWEINKADLMREGGLGRTKMKRIIEELTEAKYMTVDQGHDEDGLFTQVIYTLYESPEAQNTPAATGDRKHVNRKRITPQADNDPQHNKESLQNTEDTISDPNGSERDVKKPRQRSEKQLALDAMKNALADAFGLRHDLVTPSKWNEFGRAGKELLAVGATPEEMKPLHAWCKAKNWDSFSSIAMAKAYADFKLATTKITRAPELPTFVHVPGCPVCNYGMIVNGNGVSVQCPQCEATSKGKAS